MATTNGAQSNMSAARPHTIHTQHVSLENNIRAEIDNPLARLSLAQLDRKAAQFAVKVDPHAPDKRLWKTAARVARKQRNVSALRELTDRERAALEAENKAGFWEQPKALRITIVVLSLAAATQGWVQTGLNGANQKWLRALLDLSSNQALTANQTWIFSGVNAIMYFSASLFGCWVSDPLQSLILGRRGAMILSAGLCIAGAIGSACSNTWTQLLGCRIVLGAAMGSKAAVTPVFGAEVSPKHIRGALVMNWQLFDAFGIFLGFTANLILSGTGDSSWRYQLASTSLPALCLLTLVWTIPESPRWLLKKGRYADAYASLVALRPTPLQAAAELFYAEAQIQAELNLLPRREPDPEAIPKDEQDGSPACSEPRRREKHEAREHEDPDTGCLSLRGRIQRAWNILTDQNNDADLDQYQRCAKSTFWFTRIWQLFRIKRNRRATIAALVVNLSQQLCGINVLQFYSSTFFEDSTALNGSMRSLWFSWGFGLANFVFTFPIYYFIDRQGRRFLLLASYPGMIISMLAACLSFNIDGVGSRLGAVIFWMFAFVSFYSWGQGPVPFAYSSEVFPLLNREAGMSFSVFVNLTGAGMLALFVPRLTQILADDPSSHIRYNVGQSRLLAIFTGLNVLSLILIFLFVPETAGASLGQDESNHLNYISLEELNYIFGVPTTKHVAYQVREVLPWALRMLKWKWSHSILRKRNVTLRPAPLKDSYTWVRFQEASEDMEEKDGRRSEDH